MTKHEYDELQDRLSKKLKQKQDDPFYNGKRLEGFESAILSVKSILKSFYKENEDCWTPVKDGLPKYNEEILVTLDDYTSIDVAQMLPDDRFLVNSENLPTNGVVAWMHAPDPYRKEKKKEFLG